VRYWPCWRRNCSGLKIIHFFAAVEIQVVEIVQFKLSSSSRFYQGANYWFAAVGIGLANFANHANTKLVSSHKN
jgi:hypothetical protein